MNRLEFWNKLISERVAVTNAGEVRNGSVVVTKNSTTDYNYTLVDFNIDSEGSHVYGHIGMMTDMKSPDVVWSISEDQIEELMNGKLMNPEGKYEEIVRVFEPEDADLDYIQTVMLTETGIM